MSNGAQTKMIDALIRQLMERFSLTGDDLEFVISNEREEIREHLLRIGTASDIDALFKQAKWQEKSISQDPVGLDAMIEQIKNLDEQKEILDGEPTKKYAITFQDFGVNDALTAFFKLLAENLGDGIYVAANALEHSEVRKIAADDLDCLRKGLMKALTYAPGPSRGGRT